MRLLEPGQAAFFHYLHLDKPRRVHEEHIEGSDNNEYLVEGKPRPLLILRRLDSPKDQGATKYLVLKLTAQPGDPDKSLCLGDVIKTGKRTFAILTPKYSYHNSLCDQSIQPKKVPKNLMEGIERELADRARHAPTES